MTGPVVSSLLVAGLVGASVVAGESARRASRRATVRQRLSGVRPATPVPSWFPMLLRVAEVETDPGRAWPVACGAAVVVVVALVRWAPVSAVVIGLAFLAGSIVAPLSRRRRADVAFDADLPGAIDAVVARLVSGSSLPQALQGAAEPTGPIGRISPVGADLAGVAARHRHGSGIQDALDTWARARPGTGAALVADALALAGASGGSQARALEGVGATLVERAALGREVRALGSQARASAVVLVATPVAFATVMAVVDPRIGAVLTRTPLGWACISAGVLLDLVGAWWMARLVGAAR